jgi:2-dehydropantoate 2-reductase
MKPINDVLVAGAGAIGLTVADGLYRWNPHAVSVLSCGERLERYRKNGLYVNGERLDIRLCGTKGDERAFDLVVVACKAHHLRQIIQDMKHFVGEETVIISLLNGISSEAVLGEAFGREKLPLAMILGTDSQCSNGKNRFSTRGVIHFGDEDGKETERDERIARFFEQAGIPFSRHESDMRNALWYKFMINTGINQASAALRLPYGPFKADSDMTVPWARDLMRDAMAEVIAVSRAEGTGLEAADMDKWDETLSLLDDHSYTSMCQDVKAGRKTEVESFSLAMIEFGKKHNIAVPVNTVLYKALKAIEETYHLRGSF